jgi:integrase
MAVRKAKRKDKITGKIAKTASYFITFHDHHRREHSFAAGTDLADARQLETKIKRLVGCRKSGIYSEDVLSWIDGLPGGLRKKLAVWDLLTGKRVAAGIPLTEHLANWKAHLVSSGVSVKQAEQQYSRAERVFTAAGFFYPMDISASKTMNIVDGLASLVKHKESTGRVVSSLTKRHHLRAVKQFSRWIRTDGRATSNPLENLSFKGAVVENVRRALTADEIIYLLDYAANAGTVCNLSGAERSLIYRLGIETGLRRNEIASLKRTSFDFDGLSVKVEAQHTKNKKAAMLPVKAATMARIQAHLAGKMPTAAAFTVPDAAAKMIHKDMALARSEWIDAAKDNPDDHRRRNDSDFLKIKTAAGKVDFHSLRHTFATFLVESGVDIKTAQSLLRHSTPTMTLGIYAHTRDGNQTEAIDNLPDFEKQVSVKTGTDDFSADAIGQNTPEKNSPKIHRFNSQNTAKAGTNRHK